MKKEIFEEFIDNEIPFIKKLDSILNEAWVSDDFVSKKLIPYFFFKNTISPKGRIIISSLSNREYIYLIPFFYFTGIFKEVAENLLQEHDFKDFEVKDKVSFIFEGSSTHYANHISFTSREIRVLKPSGGFGAIDFNQFTSYQTYVRNTSNRRYLELYRKVEKFNRIFNASEDPFDIINHKEFFKYINRGAIFLTRKTQAIKYLKVDIQGEKFLQKVPIATISINRGELQVVPVSTHKGLQNKKELMVVGDLDYLEGIREIIKYKPWLSTVILDLTEEDDDRIYEVNSFAINTLEALLHEKSVKNVHILFRDYQIEQLEKFKVRNSPKSYFFINQRQKMLFSDLAKGSVHIESQKTNEVSKSVKEIISLTKKILLGVHFNDRILSFLYQMNRVSLRLISFFEPTSLKKSIESLIGHSDGLKNSIANPDFYKWFDLIKTNLIELRDLTEPIYKERLEFLNKISQQQIFILSYNDDETDKGHLKHILATRNIIFLNSKQFDTVFSKAKNSHSVVIFNLNNKLIRAISNRIFPFELYLFLSAEDSRWYDNESIRFRARSNRFSNFENLCDAIQSEYKSEYEEPNIPEIEKSVPTEEYQREFSEIFDFRAIAHNIISKSNSLSGSQSGKRETIGVIYEDGTYEQTYRSSAFYVFKEGDIRSLAELRVRAEELSPGNIVFKFKGHHKDFDHVLSEYAKSDPELARYLDEDKIWRKRIANFMAKRSLTSEDLRLRFSKNGYHFESPGNIHNWTESLVMVPDKFEELLQTMCKMNIINENELTTSLNSTKIVKTIKTKLPKELYKSHVAQENNIPFNGDRELAKLVNQIYHLVEIKEVLTLV